MSLTERGSLGLRLVESSSGEKVSEFSPEGTSIRCFEWSADGKQLVYCNNRETVVVKAGGNWEVITRLNVPRAQFFKWSPIGDQLVTFHQYFETKDNPNPGPNVIFWSIPSGEKMGSFMHKGSVSGWEPHWTADSNFILRKIGQQLIAYSRAEPTKVAHQQKVEGMTAAAVAPGRPPYKVAVFGPPKKGTAFVRILKLPELKEKLANKSFYKADSCTFKWSSTGRHLLALASTDMSQESYYGENNLYLLNSNNGESQTVDLSKKGPIYDVKWSPAGDLFCAVYGFMPAKATLYNQKGAVVFDYGTGPRNCCFFNQHGSLLMIAGFGNLRGDVECWRVGDNKNEKNEKISEAQRGDTTYFEWAPDGVHYLCATTAPRLRVSNGWKVCHYHGAVTQEYAYPMENKGEMWEMAWRPDQKTQTPEITKPSIIAQKIQQSAKSKGYVPPHARGRTDYNAKIRTDEEAPSDPNAKLKSVINNHGQPPKEMSAAALKNKKKREAKKAAAAVPSVTKDERQSSTAQPSTPAAGGLDAVQKELRKLRKKLDQVEKLKEKQTNGEELEVNQLEKLKTESELRSQIAQLEI